MIEPQGTSKLDDDQQLFADHIGAAHIKRKQQLWSEAERHFRAALAINPQNPHARTFLAQMLYRQGHDDEAIMLFRAVIQSYPTFPLCHSFLAELHQVKQRPKLAVPLFEKAVRLAPNVVKNHLGLGKSLRDIHLENEAVRALQNGLKIAPNNLELLQTLGEVSNEARLYEVATDCFERIIKITPNNGYAHSNLSLTLCSIDKLDRSRECNNRAMELLPNNAVIINNLATLLRYEDKIEEAEELLRNALKSHPKHQSLIETLGLTLLSKGDLKEALIHYEARWLRPNLAARQNTLKLANSRWQGEPLAGKTLFVWPEQGFGDYLQFIRFIPIAIEQGAKVIVGYQKPMKRLIESIPGITDFIEMPTLKAGDIEYDYNSPVISLATGFGTDIDSIPTNVPYIFTDEKTKQKWANRLTGDNFKVGLVWAGKRQHIFDRKRSMSFDTIAPVIDVEGVDFYSLQVPSDEVLKSASGSKVDDLAPELSDYMETMGAIENLDLVISVDTSVAHLVGALNKPIWMLLSSAPSLMWLREREDSPWYPSMKIFRQSRDETWEPVIARVAHALNELVASK
jgi:tetratricopeptide (TPR) repeat protein